MNENPAPKQYTLAEARSIGDKLAMDWDLFTVNQYCVGLNAESADGVYNPITGFASDDPILVGKIVRAHLNESPDYYVQWAQNEKDASRD